MQMKLINPKTFGERLDPKPSDRINSDDYHSLFDFGNSEEKD